MGMGLLIYMVGPCQTKVREQTRVANGILMLFVQHADCPTDTSTIKYGGRQTRTPGMLDLEELVSATIPYDNLPYHYIPSNKQW